MKNKFKSMVAVSLLLTACSNGDLTVTKSEHDNKMDSVNTIVAARDSAVNDLLGSFNEIERNLDSVTMKQNLISMNVIDRKGELKTSVKERINMQIAAINDLMEQNKK